MFAVRLKYRLNDISPYIHINKWVISRATKILPNEYIDEYTLLSNFIN